MAKFIFTALLLAADLANALRAADQDSMVATSFWTPSAKKGGMSAFCGTHCIPDGDNPGCKLNSKDKSTWPKVEGNRAQTVDPAKLNEACGRCTNKGGCSFEAPSKAAPALEPAAKGVSPEVQEPKDPFAVEPASPVASEERKEPVFEPEIPAAPEDAGVDDGRAAEEMHAALSGADGSNDEDEEEQIDESSADEEEDQNAAEDQALDQAPQISSDVQLVVDECNKEIQGDINFGKVDRCCLKHGKPHDLHSCVSGILWSHGLVTHRGQIVERSKANHGPYRPEAHPVSAPVAQEKLPPSNPTTVADKANLFGGRVNFKPTQHVVNDVEKPRSELPFGDRIHFKPHQEPAQLPVVEPQDQEPATGVQALKKRFEGLKK